MDDWCEMNDAKPYNGSMFFHWEHLPSDISSHGLHEMTDDISVIRKKDPSKSGRPPGSKDKPRKKSQAFHELCDLSLSWQRGERDQKIRANIIEQMQREKEARRRADLFTADLTVSLR